MIKEPGKKSTEFYVALAVLIPWIAQQLGIDLSGVAGSAEELRQTIEAAHANSDVPAWAAGAYIVGRTALKWKALK